MGTVTLLMLITVLGWVLVLCLLALATDSDLYPDEDEEDPRG